MSALNRLSADEQRGLCKQAQNGDPEALETLVRSVDGFIWKLAFFYSRRLRIDAEDLAQIGAVAAIKSVWRFNPKRLEAKFSTYACRAIVHAVCRNARQEARRIEYQPADDDLPEPKAPELHGQFGGHIDLNRLLDRLTPEDRRAVELRYGIRDGIQRTLAATGNLIGCTAERVRQRINRAIRKMRDETNFPEGRGGGKRQRGS